MKKTWPHLQKTHKHFKVDHPGKFYPFTPDETHALHVALMKAFQLCPGLITEEMIDHLGSILSQHAWEHENGNATAKWVVPPYSVSSNTLQKISPVPYPGEPEVSEATTLLEVLWGDYLHQEAECKDHLAKLASAQGDHEVVLLKLNPHSAASPSIEYHFRGLGLRVSEKFLPISPLPPGKAFSLDVSDSKFSSMWFATAKDAMRMKNLITEVQQHWDDGSTLKWKLEAWKPNGPAAKP